MHLAKGQVTDLGTFDGYPSSFANDINNANETTGVLDAQPGLLDAGVIWRDGAISFLTDTIPADLYEDINTGFAINDAGKILAQYSGFSWLALLTPEAAGPTDLTGDCRTDVDDLLIVIYEWNKTDSPADVDGNGIVDVDDLLAVINHWS